MIRVQRAVMAVAMTAIVSAFASFIPLLPDFKLTEVHVAAVIVGIGMLVLLKKKAPAGETVTTPRDGGN